MHLQGKLWKIGYKFKFKVYVDLKRNFTQPIKIDIIIVEA